MATYYFQLVFSSAIQFNVNVHHSLGFFCFFFSQLCVAVWAMN